MTPLGFRLLDAESMHMLVGVMSDRAIPRSLRMIEGSVSTPSARSTGPASRHSSSSIGARPSAPPRSSGTKRSRSTAPTGLSSPGPVERDRRRQFPGMRIGDPSLRRSGGPQLGVRRARPDQAHSGRDHPARNDRQNGAGPEPDNFFAETEQAAFHPGHVVPGVDFSNDPLLQDRLFSYTDARLSRLGGPNFHELPINRPRCPMRNFQRDASTGWT
jgi:catalase